MGASGKDEAPANKSLTGFYVPESATRRKQLPEFMNLSGTFSKKTLFYDCDFANGEAT
jgi:hypothetical protein